MLINFFSNHAAPFQSFSNIIYTYYGNFWKFLENSLILDNNYKNMEKYLKMCIRQGQSLKKG